MFSDGLVIAVPRANHQKFINHASDADPIFVEMGATRVIECRGDDVAAGTHTDFRMAVKATVDEDAV